MVALVGLYRDGATRLNTGHSTVVTVTLSRDPPLLKSDHVLFNPNSPNFYYIPSLGGGEIVTVSQSDSSRVDSTRQQEVEKYYAPSEIL